MFRFKLRLISTCPFLFTHLTHLVVVSRVLSAPPTPNNNLAFKASVVNRRPSFRPLQGTCTHPAGLHLYVPLGSHNVVFVGGHRHPSPGAEPGVTWSQRSAGGRRSVNMMLTVRVIVNSLEPNNHLLLLPGQLLLQVPARRLTPRAEQRETQWFVSGRINRK